MRDNDPNVFDDDIDSESGAKGRTWTPPDQPMGSHSWGTTPLEERKGEPIADRERHTVPEVDENTPNMRVGRVGRLLAPGDEDVDALDTESASVAWADGDIDDDLSAEELAVHTTDRFGQN